MALWSRPKGEKRRLNKDMRYRELIEAPARPWKQYRGRRHRVRLVRTEQMNDADREVFECDAFFGDVLTGRQAVLQGQFVSIVLPTGEELIGEHPRWLYDALRDVSGKAEQEGWTVLAIGRTPRFRETGLSANSGFGIHPSFPDRHVHFLEPPPNDTIED